MGYAGAVFVEVGLGVAGVWGGEVCSLSLPFSAAVGGVPSRVFHFSPGVRLVSLSSIFVERMENVDVCGSIREKRGSRVY